jgi:hypothetical protein
MSTTAMKQALDAMEYIHSEMTEEEDRRIAQAVMGLIDAIDKAEVKWIGLTDEEIKEIIGPWGETPIKGYTRKLFDQIEAKLREKNR